MLFIYGLLIGLVAGVIVGAVFVLADNQQRPRGSA